MPDFPQAPGVPSLRRAWEVLSATERGAGERAVTHGAAEMGMAMKGRPAHTRAAGRIGSVSARALRSRPLPVCSPIILGRMRGLALFACGRRAYRGSANNSTVTFD